MSEASEQDVLYKALHARLVKSGEWSRIAGVMKRKLDESGWSDDVLDFSRETMRREPALVFSALLEESERYAHSVIPAEVKQQIMSMIMDFLENNLRVE